MLHGQLPQEGQRGELVAVHGGAVGEAAEELVLPLLRVPGLGAGIGKLLELPARATHVGGCAEDDAVGCGQGVPAAFGQVAISVDGQQLGIRALGHTLGQPLGMAVAGVVNNNNLCHGQFP